MIDKSRINAALLTALTMYKDAQRTFHDGGEVGAFDAMTVISALREAPANTPLERLLRDAALVVMRAILARSVSRN